jgi:hypothetical protein
MPFTVIRLQKESPSVSPALEAAFIRYIIHEGLIEDLLPQMSNQIEEEAGWAFLS